MTDQTKQRIALPTYDECEAACHKGGGTHLQRFIIDNTPAGINEDNWRESLALVLSEVSDRQSAASAAHDARVREEALEEVATEADLRITLSGDEIRALKAKGGPGNG